MACHHCTMMSDYYSARAAQEERAEMHGAGYETETREFYETVEPRVTFKAFLQQSMDRRG